MCFKQKGANPTLSGKPLKLVDQFTYLVSNISSTEIDVNICLAKAWNDIEKLSIIWKSDLSDKIKRDFFQAVAAFILLYGCTTWTLTKRKENKASWELPKNARCCLKQILEASSYQTAAVQPLIFHCKNHSM